MKPEALEVRKTVKELWQNFILNDPLHPPNFNDFSHKINLARVNSIYGRFSKMVDVLIQIQNDTVKGLTERRTLYYLPRDLRMKMSTVFDVLKELERMGIIRGIRKQNQGRKRIEYEIDYQTIAKLKIKRDSLLQQQTIKLDDRDSMDVLKTMVLDEIIKKNYERVVP